MTKTEFNAKMRADIQSAVRLLKAHAVDPYQAVPSNMSYGALMNVANLLERVLESDKKVTVEPIEGGE